MSSSTNLPTDKTLSIRIPYEIGARLKAVCALRGVTVRRVMTDYAKTYIDHAHELPPPDAAMSLKLGTLAMATHGAEAVRNAKAAATSSNGKPAKRR
jgi:predicted DNA-binding protein